MAVDSLTTLRRSEDRQDAREGIPMVLALVSEVGEMPRVLDPDVVREGERVVAGLDTLRADLAPAQRDDDMGCVLTLLRAASFEDFADE